MNVDLLLQQLTLVENGSTRKECPGLVMVQFMPNGDLLADQFPTGRPVALRDSVKLQYTDYRDQLELRTTLTGKSWIEVQVISMTNFGLLGKLMQELLPLAKKKWPFPIGSSILDWVSDDIKKGAPQIIAAGRTDALAPNAILGNHIIPLLAPFDVMGDNQSVDPITDLPMPGRKVLLSKGSNNGSLEIVVAQA